MARKGRIRKYKRDVDNDSRLSNASGLSRREHCEKRENRTKHRNPLQQKVSTPPRAISGSVIGKQGASSDDGPYTRLRPSRKPHKRERSNTPNSNNLMQDLSPEDVHSEDRDVDDGPFIEHGHGHGDGNTPEEEDWSSGCKHSSGDQNTIGVYDTGDAIGYDEQEFDKPLENGEDAGGKERWEESHVSRGYGTATTPESDSRDGTEVVEPVCTTSAAEPDDKVRAGNLLMRLFCAPSSTKDDVHCQSVEHSPDAGELYFVSRDSKGQKHRNLIKTRKSAQTMWCRLPRVSSLQWGSIIYKPGDDVYIYTHPQGAQKGNQVEVARIHEVRTLGGSRFVASILWYYSARQAEEIGVSSDWPSRTSHVLSNWLEIVAWETVIEKVAEKYLNISDKFALHVCDHSGSHAIYSRKDRRVSWIDRPK